MFWSQHVWQALCLLLLTLGYIELILGLLPFQGSLQNVLSAHFVTTQLSPYKSDQLNYVGDQCATVYLMVPTLSKVLVYFSLPCFMGFI